MKSSFSRYNLISALFVLPVLGVILVYVLFTEPVTGGLTRLGGYLEEDFGWRDPQQGFEKSGFKRTDTLADYDHYYDVVVLGDSFSQDEAKGWQNFFYQRTGLSIVSLYMAKLKAEAFTSSGVDVESIVNSKEFQDDPPRYFVYETVERSSFIRLQEYADKPWASQVQDVAPVTTKLSTLDRPISLPGRQLSRNNFPGAEVKVQQSINYLAKALRRMAGDVYETRIFELSRSDLFSSRQPDLLLTYSVGLNKDLSQGGVDKAVRGLRAIQGLVEKNGKTRFLLLIFPDKLTAYEPYLKYKEQAIPSYLPVLSKYYAFPRLDLAYQKSLREGVKDLYLPDDSHTGYQGYMVGADAFIDYYQNN